MTAESTASSRAGASRKPTSKPIQSKKQPGPRAATSGPEPLAKKGSTRERAAEVTTARRAPSKAKVSSKPAPSATLEKNPKASRENPPPSAIAVKPARKRVKEAAGVQSEAVARRTGKSWDDWFDVLDAAGGEKLDQRGVVAVLAQKHGIGPWWQQMIAVGYEEVRGKRDKASPK